MNIYEAISSIMKKGAFVGKDKENQQQRFKYRGIDDVMNTFSPMMAEAGVFVVPEVLEARREERVSSSSGKNLIYSVLKIRYTFYAEDGTSVSATVIGEGMDSGDKASNKAMAIAMKYAMFQVFCIPTEEMTDPDAETPPESAPKPPQKQAAPQQVQAPAPQQEAPRAQKKAPQAARQAPPPPDIYPGPGESPDGLPVCDLCGMPISAHRQADGTILSPQEVAKRSIAAFDGKQLCLACGKKELQRVPA